MAIPMGLGRLGFDNLIFKRKFRWTFEVQNICGGGTIPSHYVKLASRPNLSIEETEINYLHGRTWLPGKASWETITVTYYDVATRDHAPLFNWLASIYNFSDPVNLYMGSKRSDYAGTGIIKLYDGCGQELEQWILRDVWPTAINFGELDFADSAECTIELTLRYSNVEYKSLCPPFTAQSCCSPCDGTTGLAGGTRTIAAQNIGI